MTSLRYNLFGRKILVKKTNTRWSVFYLGDEGKSRPATDIVIPADILESDIENYLSDLFHEWATKQHPVVSKIIF